jgi:exodeoxyribonuclease VII small subunit
LELTAMNKQADFEKSIAELESLVGRMESGEADLNESLTLFKRGIELSRECQLLLDNAQQTVELLSKPDDPESVEEFEPDQ